MKKQILITCLNLVIILFFAVNGLAMSSPSYTLDEDVLSGGGGGSTSATYNNTSTAGQPSAIGPSSSASYANYGGFWHGGVSPVLKGDVNGDGNVNIVDALFVARKAAGLSVASFNASAADVNCDGNINIVDALLIARKSAGLTVANWCL